MQRPNTVRTVALERGVVDLETGLFASDRPTERLSTRELELLRFLVDRRGQVVSRDTLLTEVWGVSPTIQSRCVDDTVRRLRGQVERDTRRPRHVLTVHGEGYRFVSLADDPPPAPEPQGPSALDLGPCSYEPRSGVLRWPDGHVEALTPLEDQILSVLWRAEGAWVPRRALQLQVWGDRPGRQVDYALRRMQRRLQRALGSGSVLSIEPGRGVRLGRIEPVQVPHLPPLPDDLCGREGELTWLHASPEGLVQIVGAPGVGKTRLALEYAWGWSRAHPNRPCDVIGLSAARDREDLVATVADALSLPAPGRDPVAQIGAALQARGQSLLVLDNLEQLDPPCAEAIRAWVENAPQTCFVLSSRRALLSGVGRRLSLAPLDPISATELFQRKAGALPLDEVAELVERLDHLPLAIELAATRVKTLGLSGLRLHLARSLSALRTSNAEDPRHSSLRAAFSWSLRLLAPAEQRALARAALLPSHFSARALLGAVEDLGGIELLDALLEQALVVPALVGDPDLDPRFRLLETVRSFAAEQLTDLERADALQRITAWWTQEARRLRQACRENGTARCLAEMTVELDNLLGLVELIVEDQPAAAASLLVELAFNARGAGRLARTNRLVDRALARREALPPLVTASLLLERALGRLDRQADPEITEDALLEAWRLTTDASCGAPSPPPDDHASPGLRQKVANALHIFMSERGRYEEAARWGAEEQAIVCTAQDPILQVGYLSQRANTLLQQCQIDEARGIFERCLALLGEGFVRRRCVIHYNLSLAEMAQGRLAFAEHHLRRSLSLAEETGDPALQLRSRGFLGVIRWESGSRPQGLRLVREVTAQTEALGLPGWTTIWRLCLGRLLALQGEHQAALDQVLPRMGHMPNPRHAMMARILLAACLVALGRRAELGELLHEAAAMAAGATSPHLRQMASLIGAGPEPSPTEGAWPLDIQQLARVTRAAGLGSALGA